MFFIMKKKLAFFLRTQTRCRTNGLDLPKCLCCLSLEYKGNKQRELTQVNIFYGT